MANELQSPDFLKRPLNVFDLPSELLTALYLKKDASKGLQIQEHASQTVIDGPRAVRKETHSAAPTCALCGLSFQSSLEQWQHAKSDYHYYNIKLKIRGLPPIDENAFESILGDLDISLSGSDSTSDEEDDEELRSATKNATFDALLEKQTKPEDGAQNETGTGIKTSGPFAWFSSPLVASNMSFGVYRVLFDKAELENEASLVEVLRKRQLQPFPHGPSKNVSLPTSPHVFLCMIGGGHFAAMVVSLRPKYESKASGMKGQQPVVLAHKGFHRYTTRRKQGGAQSANDSAKGAAHSAGSSLRRYNEAALETEVRQLLTEWKDMINTSERLFVRATGSANRRTLYGPYEGQVLRHDDKRLRGFPFSTHRATQSELVRAFIELISLKISQVDEAAVKAAEKAESERKARELQGQQKQVKVQEKPELSQEDEEALLHTSQLQALIRRSKIPAIVSYISKNKIPSDFKFFPSNANTNYRAPTPLHLAASSNMPAVVIALLVKCNVDPTVLNDEGKPAFDLAGNRSTRDAFRIGRSEVGEGRWDWAAANIPSPLTKAEVDERDRHEKMEADKTEKARRKAELERIRLEESQAKPHIKTTGRTIPVLEKTAADMREEEARGMTPEMRRRLERERRARAAEERIKRMQGKH